MTAAIDKKYLNQLVHVIIAACQGDAVIGGEFAASSIVYARLGLPGAVGSVDALMLHLLGHGKDAVRI